MILDEIVLQDFGLYAGKQVFDLRPKSPNRPIILIGGMNGGGKTTLLDALQLALYGKLAQCSNRGDLSYDEFLARSVHRKSAKHAAIGFDFPDDHFDTTFSVYGDSVEDIAFNLAMFVDAAEKIEAWVREETATRNALGGILVLFDSTSAAQLKWITQEPMEVVERRIGLQPIAETVEAESIDEKKVASIPVDFGG